MSLRLKSCKWVCEKNALKRSYRSQSLCSFYMTAFWLKPHTKGEFVSLSWRAARSWLLIWHMILINTLKDTTRNVLLVCLAWDETTDIINTTKKSDVVLVSHACPYPRWRFVDVSYKLYSSSWKVRWPCHRWCPGIDCPIKQNVKGIAGTALVKKEMSSRHKWVWFSITLHHTSRESDAQQWQLC